MVFVLLIELEFTHQQLIIHNAEQRGYPRYLHRFPARGTKAATVDNHQINRT